MDVKKIEPPELDWPPDTIASLGQAIVRKVNENAPHHEVEVPLTEGVRISDGGEVVIAEKGPLLSDYQS